MTAFGPSRPGPAGRDPGINYKFNTATSGDPGSGKLLLNNAALASATALHISETDDDGASISAMLATWDDGTSTIRGRLLIRKVGTPASFAEYRISGTLTDSGTYDQFTIAHVASGGSFSSDDELMLTFVPKGDKGDAGSGTAGADGRDAGWNYKFNSSTVLADPGSGKFLLDNSTIASATVLYISHTDDDANSIASVIAMWQASSTNPVKGTLEFRKAGAPTTFAVFDATNGGTALAGVSGFDLVHIASAGTFNNNDEFTVSFRAKGLLAVPSGGSASAPGLPVNGDSNTGILANVADQFAIVAGGTEVARWTSDGIQARVVTNLNNIAASGYYKCVNNTTNAPTTAFYMIHCVVYDTNWQVQHAWSLTTPPVAYRRYKDTGTFGSWVVV